MLLTSSVGCDGTDEADVTGVGACVPSSWPAVPSVEGESVGCKDPASSGTGGPSEFVPTDTAGVGGGVKPVSSTGSGSEEGLIVVAAVGLDTDGIGVGASLLLAVGWEGAEWEGDAVGWWAGVLAVGATEAADGACRW